jgi:hypothetical protein
VAADFGPVDVVVNNAGVTRDGVLHKMTFDDWNEVMRINLGGCFNMAKATFPGMRERGWGRIVNIGSINGQAGQYGQVNYAAAKSGIHGFTKALAQEGAKYGVTVNAIAPGYIDTDMVAAVPPAVLEKIVAKIPVGRLGHAPKSRAAWRSSVRKRQASSPDRRCRSTAASICTDRRTGGFAAARGAGKTGRGFALSSSRQALGGSPGTRPRSAWNRCSGRCFAPPPRRKRCRSTRWWRASMPNASPAPRRPALPAPSGCGWWRAWGSALRMTDRRGPLVRSISKRP